MNVAEELLPPGWQSYAPAERQQLLNRLAMFEFRLDYRDDWAKCARDCFQWHKVGADAKPTPYQLEAIEKLQHEKRLAIRGPHGLGKTGIAALVILIFALTRDGEERWKAPTTASVGRQLREYLWPEVHTWAHLLDWAKVGRPPFAEPRELQDMALRLSTGQAFAASPGDAATLEGAHADQILYVFDEAKTIDDDTFDAAEGAFSNAGPEHPERDAFALALSTPGEPQGRFYSIHKRDPRYSDWKALHVRKEQAIAAGRISADWVAKRLNQWGADSAVYLNRVEGEFAASSEQSVIPLAWVEQAIERWRDLTVPGIRGGRVLPPESLEPFKCCGVDVADQGEDRTAIAVRHGMVITQLRTFPYNPDPMETTGETMKVLRRAEFKGFAVIDANGVGSGVVARLRELRAEGPPAARPTYVGFQAAGTSRATDMSGELEFANLRAEAWWTMRDLLDPSQPGGSLVCLPDDDGLIGDLTAPRWRTTSGGKVLIEEKEHIRKRLKRSTDVGDAVVMAFWARAPRVRSASPNDYGARIPGT